MSRRIARERIERLFELADKRVEEDRQELADRYVEIARNIGMKYNVSIPSELRKRFCHECHAFLTPGFNCTVRVNSKNSTINYHCENCGHVNRYGY